MLSSRPLAVRRQDGFSLTEVMMTLVIIGILMAVAVPMYQDSMRKSRRADAMRELMELGSRQERFYAQNSRYTNVISEGTGLDLGRTETRDGHYDLRVVQCVDNDGNSIALDQCYVLQATPKGEQANDEECAIIRVDSLGQRESVDAKGYDSDCW